LNHGWPKATSTSIKFYYITYSNAYSIKCINLSTDRSVCGSM